MSKIDQQLNWLADKKEEDKDNKFITIGNNIVFNPETGLVVFDGNTRLRYLNGELNLLGAEGTTEPPTKDILANIKKQLDDYISKKNSTNSAIIKSAERFAREEQERTGKHPEEYNQE